MTTSVPAIEFFEGVSEQISNVSLRLNRSSGVRTVLMTFTELNSIQRFKSFTSKFNGALRLLDEEGEITIEPDSVKFVFGGPEGDDFERMDCQFEVNREDHWERFMRFMNRYAAVNGMDYGDRS
ncbi:photosystem II reaction center protein Psb28 [Leptolyngbya sp. 'hensonii']|uniref:photosystem II reaction center protein Psb28 n=1 Tax=Leptolyngbya sp. 'hensonii' TaxID=1922337 RepID=UPI00094FDB72|nr:photosystem II reaction center protein Psb28 [Leptolyngbya sp. 'hensonii']OLP17114.1 photosystem II reaction center protein Psb28 [Leptolyngbya sp. 'hensonii']